MSKKTVSVEVESASYDVGQELVKIVKAVKAGVDAGKPALEVGATLLATELAGLIAAVGQVGQIASESTEDLAAFLKAWTLAGDDIAAALLAPKPAPAVESTPAAV